MRILFTFTIFNLLISNFCFGLEDNTLRIKRGLESFESDLYNYFEGFILSDQFNEKFIILNNIEDIVSEMEKLSKEIRYKGSDILVPISRAYYIKALSFLYLGDIITSNHNFSLSEKLLEDIKVNWNEITSTYISLNNNRKSFNELRNIYNNFVENFTRVQFYKKEDFKISHQDSIILNYKGSLKNNNPNNSNIYGLYFFKQKFKEAVNDTNFISTNISLPISSYEILNLRNNEKLASFRIQKSNKIKKISIPTKGKNLFYYLFLKWLF